MWQKLINSRLFLLAVFLALGFTAFLFVRATWEKRAVERELADLKQELSTLETKKVDLTQLLEYTGTSAFVEKEARRRFNLRKADEDVSIVFNNDNDQKPAEKTAAAPGQESALTVAARPLTNSEKWWQYFFGPRIGSGPDEPRD